MENKIITPVTKGLVISLILILVSMAIYLAGESQNKALGSIQFLPFVGGLIWTCVYYAKQMQGNVTFGDVFAHGFKTTAVVIIIMVAYTVLSFTVLFPEMIEQAMSIAQAEMEKKGQLSDEQISNAMGMARKFMIPAGIGGVILGYGIIGAIASAIGAALAKKNPQTPFN